MSLWDFDTSVDTSFDIPPQLLEPDFQMPESNIEFNKYDFEWPNYACNDFNDLFDGIYSSQTSFSLNEDSECKSPPSKKIKIEDPTSFQDYSFQDHSFLENSFPDKFQSAEVPLPVLKEETPSPKRSTPHKKIVLLDSLPTKGEIRSIKREFSPKRNDYTIFDDLSFSANYFNMEYGRRSDHNVREQQRRRVITNLMERLRVTVPYTKGVEKATRLKILQETTEFIIHEKEAIERKIDIVSLISQKIENKSKFILDYIASVHNS
ncbi:uncharacterized protein LOC115229045 [Octopus sinensis]|uniref:Uncharacterized protein LOC115229045 n=1 Tax=Octopus sinensis TaxID=2607531 RepID=A0A6P7TZH3_9MOLL|nr:uncharacterized protein LOC115229045 [Octopus sinensis]